jgi:hypothetical protein
MKMARVEAPSLSYYVTNTSSSKNLYDHILSACIADLNRGTSLGGWAKELVGRSVLLATSSQFTTALALIELDGRARRLTILPQYVVKDMEIGQPINSKKCSETADGVARESKGVKSCPRAGCGKSACPVR